MGDGTELVTTPRMLGDRWKRDRKLGGVTRTDGKWNLHKTPQHHQMIGVYRLTEDGRRVLVSFRSELKDALKRVHASDLEDEAVEAKLEWERSMQWVIDCA